MMKDWVIKTQQIQRLFIIIFELWHFFLIDFFLFSHYTDTHTPMFSSPIVDILNIFILCSFIICYLYQMIMYRRTTNGPKNEFVNVTFFIIIVLVDRKEISFFFHSGFLSSIMILYFVFLDNVKISRKRKKDQSFISSIAWLSGWLVKSSVWCGCEFRWNTYTHTLWKCNIDSDAKKVTK